MGWMLGTDTHHARSKNERWAGQFNIIKATEGTSFIDPEFEKILYDMTTKGQFRYPLGVYHFLSARSETAKQIDFFVSTVEPLKGKVLLALDYEAEYANSDPAGKHLEDAIRELSYRTNNAQIVIYMDKGNELKIERKKPSIMNYPNVCLWLADYTGVYNGTWAPIMRQVCTSPCDIDVFYGSEQSFMDIAKSWK